MQVFVKYNGITRVINTTPQTTVEELIRQTLEVFNINTPTNIWKVVSNCNIRWWERNSTLQKVNIRPLTSLWLNIRMHPIDLSYQLIA